MRSFKVVDKTNKSRSDVDNPSRSQEDHVGDRAIPAGCEASLPFAPADVSSPSDICSSGNAGSETGCTESSTCQAAEEHA
jgi:hypothetical protein